ncbi:MAG: peptidylprolyl isomerase [Bryobacteraceae bacterium]
MSFRLFCFLIGGLRLATCWAQPAAAPRPVAPDAVIMHLDGKPVTKAEFDKLASGFQAATREPVELSRTLVVQLGEAYALDAAARKRGLADVESIASHIRFRTAQLLAAELFKAIQADLNRDEAGMRANYESRKSEFLLPRVRQILVAYKGARSAASGVTRSMDEARGRANGLKQKLDSGADFAALARTESDDRATGANGGALGVITRGQTLPEFEKLAFELGKGRLGGPVKTEQGFHLILVEDRQTMEFEKLRATLVFELARQRLDQIAKEGYKVNEAVVPAK